MNNELIIRAWKDRSFRATLSEGAAAALPAVPVAAIELNDEDVDGVSGGEIPITTWTCLIIAVSAAGSCTPGCSASVWDGTCNVASVGCCTA